jgi:hypothetical protein
MSNNVMSNNAVLDIPIVRRLRRSPEFTCSRCGGHEAYFCRSQRVFDRYLLAMVMVRPVRCSDCDALCYTFPVRPDGPILNGTERTPLLSRAM